jgi:hypothetical protein
MSVGVNAITIVIHRVIHWQDMVSAMPHHSLLEMVNEV